MADGRTADAKCDGSQHRWGSYNRQHAPPEDENMSVWTGPEIPEIGFLDASATELDNSGLLPDFWWLSADGCGVAP